MSRSILSIIISLSLFIISCEDQSTPKNDSLYQTSTFDALLTGNYEGTLSFEELSKKGDFGIGTFNELDGEMIALDGSFYQIKADGRVYPVQAEMKTPFAAVTNFIADTSFKISKNINYNELNNYLDQILPSKNIFYAIKVEGKFEQAITRSVPKQDKPYQPLVEVVKSQPLFDLNNLAGVMVGFRVPEYMEGINVPAYHFHFMNEERTKGGHLLECVISDIIISIDYIHEIQISLLETEEFYQIDLLKDRSKESELVER
jgi:acetolactate decarboxylase